MGDEILSQSEIDNLLALISGDKDDNTSENTNSKPDNLNSEPLGRMWDISRPQWLPRPISAELQKQLVNNLANLYVANASDNIEVDMVFIKDLTEISYIFFDPSPHEYLKVRLADETEFYVVNFLEKFKPNYKPAKSFVEAALQKVILEPYDFASLSVVEMQEDEFVALKSTMDNYVNYELILRSDKGEGNTLCYVVLPRSHFASLNRPLLDKMLGQIQLSKNESLYKVSVSLGTFQWSDTSEFSFETGCLVSTGISDFYQFIVCINNQLRYVCELLQPVEKNGKFRLAEKDVSANMVGLRIIAHFKTQRPETPQPVMNLKLIGESSFDESTISFIEECISKENTGALVPFAEMLEGIAVVVTPAGIEIPVSIYVKHGENYDVVDWLVKKIET